MSIIPALVTMRVLKQQGRWPGAGGVYGGYPVSSCCEAPARPVVGGARIAPVSYALSARGGGSASGRGYQSFDGLSLLALLFGLLSLVAGVGFFAVCMYAHLWALFPWCCVWLPSLWVFMFVVGFFARLLAFSWS